MKEPTGITRAQIERLRRRIKPGDKIRIITFKAQQAGFGVSRQGVCRTATVLDTTNPNFCRVCLDNGIQDCVLWSDLVGGERSGKSD